MNAALGQTRKDVQAFLQLLPDICVKQVQFTTIAVLPLSEKPKSNLCSSCDQIVVFRDDLWWVICTSIRRRKEGENVGEEKAGKGRGKGEGKVERKRE